MQTHTYLSRIFFFHLIHIVLRLKAAKQLCTEGILLSHTFSSKYDREIDFSSLTAAQQTTYRLLDAT